MTLYWVIWLENKTGSQSLSDLVYYKLHFVDLSAWTAYRNGHRHISTKIRRRVEIALPGADKAFKEGPGGMFRAIKSRWNDRRRWLDERTDSVLKGMDLLPDEDGQESPRQFATPLEIRSYLENDVPVDGFGIFLISHLMDSSRMVLTRNFESAGRCMENIERAGLLPTTITTLWWQFLEESVNSKDPYAMGIPDNSFYVIERSLLPSNKINAILDSLADQDRLEESRF